jgi:hypothetical protein
VEKLYQGEYGAVETKGGSIIQFVDKTENALLLLILLQHSRRKRAIN